jgi:hypothetical protein
LGIVGLCKRCENEYAKLNPPKDGFEGFDNYYQFSDSGDEKEEVKPTPPLKDIRSPTSPNYSRKNPFTPPCTPKSLPNIPSTYPSSLQPPPTPPTASKLSLRPKPHPRARVVLGEANVKPKPGLLTHHDTVRRPSHVSHRAEIQQLWDSDSDSDQALAACESAFLAKKDYYGKGDEKAKKELKSWSDVYASRGAGRGESESDKRSKSRDSLYYGFYEDVLGDYVEKPRKG